jgi:DNA-binding SARP family transcriptional activator
MLEVHLLGQFDVRRGQEAVEIPSRPAQSLLAYLILSAGTSHRREKLAGLLWPDANEENARSNLRHALWRLRKAIGGEHLDADKISISFDKESEYWLDAALMERGDGAERSSEELLKIVTNYGGELLPGFYDDWVILERERYRSLFKGKIQALLNRLVEEQKWAHVLEWGERWLALGQVPEPAYRALMIAYSGLGDAAGMAAVYKRCIQALQAELGVEPSEETVALYEQLKEGGGPVSTLGVKVAAPVGDSVAAVHSLLDQWRAQGVEVLDLPSLAIVQASLGEFPVGDEDASLLIRSALHHAVEVEPWLERAKSEDVAVEALMDVYDTHPKPLVRGRIVNALKTLETDVVGEATYRIAIEDDAPNVRSEAAIDASSRGNLKGVLEQLLVDVNTKNSASALAAFVAVADEVGLPEGIGPYPKLSVWVALAQRRWRANSEAIRRQIVRAGLGGAIAMALVGIVQILPATVLNPAFFDETVELMPIAMTMIAGALLGLFWGGLQGIAIGLHMGLTDVLWRGTSHPKWRLFFAGLAGLTYSIIYILLSISGGFSPEAGPEIYIPLYLLYGFFLGMALSLIVPELGLSSPTRRQIQRSLWASSIIAILSIPLELLVYPVDYVSAISLDLIFAIIFPLGIALALRSRVALVVESISS